MAQGEQHPHGVDLRLVPSAVGAWGAAWWACGTEAAAGFVGALGALALAVAASAASRRRARRFAQVALVAAVVAVVLAGAGHRLATREAGPVPAWAADGARAVVTGRVLGDPQQLQLTGPGGQARWLVRLRPGTVSARGGDARTGGPVVVLGDAAWSTVIAGSHVRAVGKLRPPRPADPAVAFMIARRPPETVAPGAWPWRAAERLRAGLRSACAGLPDDPAGLLPALVVGDTSRLPPRLEDDLQASGLTHLTAVSGANVSILAGAVIAALAWAGAGRRARTMGTGLVVAGFVVLARPEPSVVRAAAMGGVGLLGLLQARRGAGVPALAVTVIVLLAVDPWLSRSFGFLLSALATAALLLLVPAWVRRWRLPRPVAIALAVPLAAQVITAPVVVLLDPAISLVAVPANLLAGPAVVPATVAGVLAAAISPLWPWAAHVVAGVGGLATAWIAAVAHRSADVPGGSMPWLPGRSGALLLSLLVLVGVAASARPRRPRPQRRPRVEAGHLLPVVIRRPFPPDRRAIRRAAVVGLTAAIVGWFAGPLWPWPRSHDDARDAWLAVQCDVGQGDALLLRSGARSAVLVDAGPDPGPVDSCLRRWKVEELDLVVITHFHADHAGGLTGALQGRGSPPVLVSPLSAPDEHVRSVARAGAAAGSQVRAATAGMAGTTGEPSWPVRWRVVWPPKDARAAGVAEPDSSEVNDASVAILAEVSGVLVAALGDLEEDPQRVLAAQWRGGAPLVDVVKVAHHGSASQYPPLYSMMRPRVALIGVGADNDYGHPAPSALSMLTALGARVLSTDRHGDAAVTGPAGSLGVRTQRNR